MAIDQPDPSMSEAEAEEVFGWILDGDASDEEIARRQAAWTPRIAPPDSGYAMLHHSHVMGADTGADLDFMLGSRGAPVGKDSH